MLYEKYLKGLNNCPFCELSKEEILKQNDLAILTMARAPYTKDHLLIVPKRHVKKLNKMTTEEKDAVEKLVYYGMKKLHRKYRDVTLLYKEGSKKGVGKSIDHLHYHLIPELQIGSSKVNWKTRKLKSDEEYKGIVKKFRDKL
jgi:ATP adenylyltransferase